MPPPVKHRMNVSRSAGSFKGNKTLSMHRGAPPADSGARMTQAGAPTRSGKSRFLKSQSTQRAAEGTRLLLAAPKKPQIVKEPLLKLPPKPKALSPAARTLPPPPHRSANQAPPPTAAPAAPVRVSPVAAFTNKDRERIFGRFDFTPAPSAGNPERIRVDPMWASDHIVTLRVPALEALVPGYDPSVLPSSPLPAGLIGLPRLGVPFHKLVMPYFVELIDAWGAAGLLSSLKTWNGSYVPRFRRGQAEKQVLSAHSWGSAFDINARWNVFKQIPAPLGEKGSVLALVDIANSLGWMWGGDFTSPDGMHFEAGPGVFSPKA